MKSYLDVLVAVLQSSKKATQTISLCNNITTNESIHLKIGRILYYTTVNMLRKFYVNWVVGKGWIEGGCTWMYLWLCPKPPKKRHKTYLNAITIHILKHPTSNFVHRSIHMRRTDVESLVQFGWLKVGELRWMYLWLCIKPPKSGRKHMFYSITNDQLNQMSSNFVHKFFWMIKTWL
jgi:hypothetical protein